MTVTKIGTTSNVVNDTHPSAESEFEILGRTLTEAMSTYTHHLQAEKLPLPSFEPSVEQQARTLTHPEGLASRDKIVELAQRICALTMNPQMNMLISSLQFHFCSCLKVALDLRVQDYVPRRGRITVGDLAFAVGAEEGLLVRIMRVLTNKYIFAEPAPGYFSHTAMSWTMCGQDAAHLLMHRLDEPFRASSRQADALAASSYREPGPHDPFGFHLAFNTQHSFWQYISHDDPHRGQRFDYAMRAVNLNSLDNIPAMYPFDTLIAGDEYGGKAVLVDVGGGRGQVANKIMSYYAGSGLRCIVQDKSIFDSVKESVCAGDGGDDKAMDVEMQQHDFFQEQPVKGASAYFFRHIFHDWPESDCVRILQKTVAAMNIYHSRILICDQVVDELSPSTASILYDIDMMTLFGGKERTLHQWETLLKAADQRLYISQVVKRMETTIIDVRVRVVG